MAENARLVFEDIEFEERGGKLTARLLKLFGFPLDKKALSKIGEYRIKKNSIDFIGISRDEAERKFNRLIAQNVSHLKNSLTGRKAVYIHKNSGIPLIGTLYFGIVDKGTDMIEVKPITGCNIDCVFCSVGEGLHSKKEIDYVVEEDYIVEELEKLLEFKRQKEKHTGMKVFINPHGEPLLYSNIVSLAGRISKMRDVETVAIITNGTMLSENIIDELGKAGLNQLNISISSLDPKKAKQLSGLNSYDIDHIKRAAEYASKKMKVVIAPVWLRGMNDEDVEGLIQFAKKIGAETGIQKFISHKTGKKPAEEIEWEEFYKKIDEWEKKYGMKLRYCETIIKTEELPMPFRQDDIVKVVVVCDGRRKNENIAVAKGRCMLIFGCSKKPGSEIKVRIKTAKHNMFTAEEI